MNIFHHKDLGNHLLQLCPKVVKHPVYRVLVEKPEGKRALGRHRRRWEDSIKMDLQEEECGGMDWIELAQDRAGGGHV